MSNQGRSDGTGGGDALSRVAAEDGPVVTDQDDRYGTSDDPDAIDAASGGSTEEGGDVLREGPAGVAGVGGADGLPGGTDDGDAVGRTGARSDEPERGEDVAAV